MHRKTRKDKANEYEEKFSHIPIDYKERLSWLYDNLHISETESFNILQTKSLMMDTLRYSTFTITLFEIPEGAPRPRMRLVNRKNFADLAIANPNFIHVYSPTGYEDNSYMRRIIDSGELHNLCNSIIYTPCIVDIYAFLKTPSSFNREQVILSEIGLIKPISKPDFDNIAKKYADMFNKNIWLDDALVTDGYVHKMYSVLPRLEIKVSYLNMLYTKQQSSSMVNKLPNEESPLYFRKGDYL